MEMDKKTKSLVEKLKTKALYNKVHDVETRNFMSLLPYMKDAHTVKITFMVGDLTVDGESLTLITNATYQKEGLEEGLK